MARKLEPTEDVKLNMTPMIDMTFLLVIFFVLTVDLTRKEFLPVQLPFATKGEENKERETVHKRFIINLNANGVATIKGREFPLANEDPLQQAKSMKDMTQMLVDFLAERRKQGEEIYEPDGACRVPVLLHADRGAHWKYIQWIMRVVVDQKIKIYKIQFSVKRPPGMSETDDAPTGGA